MAVFTSEQVITLLRMIPHSTMVSNTGFGHKHHPLIYTSWERWFKDKCLKLSGRINVLSLLFASALTVSQYSLVVRDDEPPSNHIGMMASVIPCGHTITNVTTTSCRQSNIFQSPVTVKSLQIQIANAQFECKQMKWIRK